MTSHVEILAEADIEPAAAVLGRAFRDNPMNRAVIGGDAERREACNRAGVEAYLPGPCNTMRLCTLSKAYPL